MGQKWDKNRPEIEKKHTSIDYFEQHLPLNKFLSNI